MCVLVKNALDKLNWFRLPPTTEIDEKHVLDTITQAGFTPIEIEATLDLVHSLPTVKSETEAHHVLVKDCMKLSQGGVFLDVKPLPVAQDRPQFTWEQVRNLDFKSKLSFWNEFVQHSEDPLDKARSLKNMCLVIKQELDGKRNSAITDSFRLNVRDFAAKAGFTPEEIEMIFHLVSQWHTTDNHMKLLLEDCSTLGKSGAIVELSKWPQSIDRRWDSVKDLDVVDKMKFWSSVLDKTEDGVDSARIVVSIE